MRTSSSRFEAAEHGTQRDLNFKQHSSPRRQIVSGNSRAHDAGQWLEIEADGPANAIAP
jgi:hypothetical protein